MWPALLTEDEKIQTGVITPLGNQRAELGKGGSAEQPGPGGSSAFTMSGLSQASQVASGPQRHLFGIVECQHGSHKARISQEGPDLILCPAVSPCVTNFDVKSWLWTLKNETETASLSGFL